MDIKDFILVGGGILIAAVVMHGFWIAWKARRDPLRIDLVTDLPEVEDEDDLRRLRAELPNGGARVVCAGELPRQGDLDLARGGPNYRPDGAVDQPPEHSASRSAPAPRKTEPRLGPAPNRPVAPQKPAAPHKPAAANVPPARAPGAGAPEPGGQRPVSSRPVSAERPRSSGEPKASPPDKVADVTLPERAARLDEPREPRRWPARKPAAESRPVERPASRPARGRGVSAGSACAAGDARKSEQPVQELIVVNVLAPKGKPFVGGGLIEALRARGLRYGDMNIFHRLDPKTRQSLYSVANVVEPGTFDIADLDGFRSPGVCFFMQLPGPEHPMETFEDMLKVARDVALRVGGSLLDEQRSVMTGQTVEHYRQRISDFCRRRMSMRA